MQPRVVKSALCLTCGSRLDFARVDARLKPCSARVRLAFSNASSLLVSGLFCLLNFYTIRNR
jgi:hypothetical protein